MTKFIMKYSLAFWRFFRHADGREGLSQPFAGLACTRQPTGDIYYLLSTKRVLGKRLRMKGFDQYRYRKSPAIRSFNTEFVSVSAYWHKIYCGRLMFSTIQTTANLSASFSLSMSTSRSIIGWVTCRLGTRRLTALRRQVSVCLPPNRTYTSPRIRLSISNITRFICTMNHSVTAIAYNKCFSAPFKHQCFPRLFPFESSECSHLVHYHIDVLSA